MAARLGKAGRRLSFCYEAGPCGYGRYSSLFVIARNSCFTYKGRAVDVKEVGRGLGVRYVLEGSLRKAGERIRVTAQLVDAETGKHVWAQLIQLSATTAILPTSSQYRTRSPRR
jgi:TolB-like protein